jgi:hypothetical protein
MVIYIKLIDTKVGRRLMCTDRVHSVAIVSIWLSVTSLIIKLQVIDYKRDCETSHSYCSNRFPAHNSFPYPWFTPTKEFPGVLVTLSKSIYSIHRFRYRIGVLPPRLIYWKASRSSCSLRTNQKALKDPSFIDISNG